MMQKIIPLLLIFILLTVSVPAQIFKCRLNRYNHKGLRTGLWITYTDSAKTQIEKKGRFRKGHEKGTWRYFDESGMVRKKEKFRRDQILTTTFYPEGMKESSGVAVIVEEEIYLHYYYTGEWQYFNKSGELVKTVVYDKGRETSSMNTIR